MPRRAADQHGRGVDSGSRRSDDGGSCLRRDDVPALVVGRERFAVEAIPFHCSVPRAQSEVRTEYAEHSEVLTLGNNCRACRPLRKELNFVQSTMQIVSRNNHGYPGRKGQVLQIKVGEFISIDGKSQRSCVKIMLQLKGKFIIRVAAVKKCYM